MYVCTKEVYIRLYSRSRYAGVSAPERASVAPCAFSKQFALPRAPCCSSGLFCVCEEERKVSRDRGRESSTMGGEKRERVSFRSSVGLGAAAV